MNILNIRGEPMVKNRKKMRSYNSKAIHEKNLKKTMEEIKNITPFAPEPRENIDAINNFYKEKRLDREWNKRRKLR